MVSDFNQDGYPDMAYVNINGDSRAFINKGGDHNYIGFRFPEMAEYSGAKVTVKLKDGSIRSDDYVVGEGQARTRHRSLPLAWARRNPLKRFQCLCLMVGP